MMLKAHAYHEVDKSFERHHVAYLSAAAKSTDANGKAKFPRFKKFFDYQRELAKLKTMDKPKKKSKRTAWIEYKKRKEASEK